MKTTSQFLIFSITFFFGNMNLYPVDRFYKIGTGSPRKKDRSQKSHFSGTNTRKTKKYISLLFSVFQGILNSLFFWEKKYFKNLFQFHSVYLMFLSFLINVKFWWKWNNWLLSQDRFCFLGPVPQNSIHIVNVFNPPHSTV